MFITINDYEIYQNGNGYYHREDGSAIEYADGFIEWWVNGKLHREDGPAIENANGSKYWYVNGMHITFLKDIIKIIKYV